MNVCCWFAYILSPTCTSTYQLVIVLCLLLERERERDENCFFQPLLFFWHSGSLTPGSIDKNEAGRVETPKVEAESQFFRLCVADIERFKWQRMAIISKTKNLNHDELWRMMAVLETQELGGWWLFIPWKLHRRSRTTRMGSFSELKYIARQHMQANGSSSYLTAATNLF